MSMIFHRATNHPSCPGSRRYVRVPVYVSNLIIKPHNNPDDVGLDYLLTYCDDPRTVLPTSLTSWVVTNGKFKLEYFTIFQYFIVFISIYRFRFQRLNGSSG